MKILITDIFLRKTFDVVNILRRYYNVDNLIFTNNNPTALTKVKCRLLYGSSSVFILRTEPHNFINDLEKISEHFVNEKLIYIPIEEATTLLFYEFLNKKENLNCQFLLPLYDVFNMVRDKKLLNEFCEQNHIACPKLLHSADIKKSTIELPIIVKPRQGSGAKGITYINNEIDLEAFLSTPLDFDTFFVQERLPESQNVVGGFFLCINGEIISYYSHKRLRTYPKTGGVSVYAQTFISDEIYEEGKRIISKLNWSGFIMIEYIFDNRDQKFKLIEINPRLWGSVLLSEFNNALFLKKYIELATVGSINDYGQVKPDTFIRWVFPYDFMNWARNYFRPIGFLRADNKTCYVNISYAKPISSALFMLLALFDKKQLYKLFRILK